MNIAQLVEVKPNPNIPDLAPGDTVKVHTKIVEGEKERTQVFQGTVIKQRRTQAGVSFTVRHVAYGVGVERTFPSSSPLVEKVEIIRHGKVRRAKLYYLRGLSGKASRIKERRVEREAEGLEQAAEEQPGEPPQAELQPAQEQPAQPEVQPPSAQQPESQPQPGGQPAQAEAQPPPAQPPEAKA